MSDSIKSKALALFAVQTGKAEKHLADQFRCSTTGDEVKTITLEFGGKRRQEIEYAATELNDMEAFTKDRLAPAVKALVTPNL
jgi:hypothetical protein